MKTHEEIILEYKRGDPGKREYLWIFYRNLRSLFEEIDNIDQIYRD